MIRGGGDASLLRATARRLAEGPVHTLDLARDVLHLTGHPGAASAAVFALLGSDPRFRLDPDGCWRLAPGAAATAAPLEEIGFAVVDVETTGGASWRGHRIVEIAIVEVRGGRVTDEYATLVNPGRELPPGIVALTGITPDSVRGAPFFDHVAGEVHARLEDRTFVAHNAGFDWGFVSAELVASGVEVPEIPRLCTVRMCRRLVPELRRRNLDEAARHFGLVIHPRHRAHGDALATARILIRLLEAAEVRGIRDLNALMGYVGDPAARSRRGRGPRSDGAQVTMEGV